MPPSVVNKMKNEQVCLALQNSPKAICAFGRKLKSNVQKEIKLNYLLYSNTEERARRLPRNARGSFCPGGACKITQGISKENSEVTCGPKMIYSFQ